MSYTKEEYEELRKKIIFNLKHIYDPEIPVNIYDLGLIYKIEFEEENNYLYTTITMTLTSPGCPVADAILSEVKYLTQAVDIVDEVFINLVFDPPWNQAMVSDEGKDILMMEGTFI